ncbi:pancreatic secretory granule membrane major glycoprotein GP2-like [Silurus meridionalis]|nr:pancreatic secretory granule membrane major glycoprotein GP2-like [Silurus meridionalis]
MCGSTLEKNSTHITFRNNVGTTDGMGVISHVSGLNIAFSCVYPLMQRISLSLGIEESVISKELSSVGFYQISMIPYIDSHFLHPYSGNVTLEVNQLMYIFMEVNQFNNNQTINNSQIALVLDNCWATPIDQIDSNIRWNLIINSCPNPADGTVAVLQNGVSTSSRFSFRMFTFTGLSNIIYLHCQVHLCLRDSENCTLPCI